MGAANRIRAQKGTNKMQKYIILTFLLVIVKCDGINITKVHKLSSLLDKITFLPGATPQPSYAMYSGYLYGGQNAPGSTNHIFYW